MTRILLATAAAAALSATAALAATVEWPSYNRTLSSERFAPLKEINTKTVGGLKVLCTYDAGEVVGFQTGLIQTGGSLFAVTEHDVFSIDPNSCREKWRAHEEFKGSALASARGAAVMGGRVFRGTSDGKVRAYDAETGRPLWATAIADLDAGESIPAAPIAWGGMVFIGQAGGDRKAVKGRMYALDAATGKIVWEAYLVPKEDKDVARGPQAPGAPAALLESWKNTHEFPMTGGATWTSYSLDPKSGLLYVPGGNPAPDFLHDTVRDGDNLFTNSVVVLDARTGRYRSHVQMVPRDYHDWDMASAPPLFTTKSGKRMMAAAPKDGQLYGVDLATNKIVYKVAVTTQDNVDTPLTPEGVRFCPGTKGGNQWNGPAYDPLTDAVLVGEVDWCSTVHTDPKATAQAVPDAGAWGGASRDGFGTMDDVSRRAGRLTSADATTGAKRWAFNAPQPILGGVTPTAGGLVLFGDIGGNLYAFDSATGAKLWSQNLGAAVGGGVVTYDTGKGQRLAVAAGPISPIWLTPKANARVVILGLK